MKQETESQLAHLGRIEVTALVKRLNQRREEERVKQEHWEMQREEAKVLYQRAIDILNKFGRRERIVGKYPLDIGSPLEISMDSLQTSQVEVAEGNIFLIRLNGVLDLGSSPDEFSVVHVVYKEEDGTVTPLFFIEEDSIRGIDGLLLSRGERMPLCSVLDFLEEVYNSQNKSPREA